MVFKYRFSLAMSSVDAAGVLFYPELFRHAHDAYEAWLGERGVSLAGLAAAGRYVLPVVHAEADYRMPMRQGSPVRVAVRVARVGATSFTMGFDFLDEQGTAMAVARSVHVAVSAESGDAIPLPENLREVLAET